MASEPRAGPLARSRRPLMGVAAGGGAIVATTLLVYPLRGVAPPVSLGVVYLLGVLLVASIWGAWLGLATAVASAIAFNFFHIPPTGRFTIAQGENWVALVVFFVAALVASELAQRARRRAEEAEQRRAEADLAAEMARLLARGEDVPASLPAVVQRLGAALDLPWAQVELGAGESDDRRIAFALREGPRQIGTFFVPAGLPEAGLRRLQERVVPSLEALLAAGLERDALRSDQIETAALRRSDVVKTALLRTVSHDLRSPLTAIMTAAGPLAATSLGEESRRELVSVINGEAERLSRLIDDLLDLTRLEAHAVEPRPEACDLAETIRAAADQLRRPDGTFRLQLSSELPLIRADAVQLERALANVLENSSRYSGGEPVLVKAWPLHNRVMVRVVDRGPGIPRAQQERIFEPFYRAGTESTGHRGSGLGLAIARGFVEANGGRIWVESLPGQGTSFVLELPLEPAGAEDGGAKLGTASAAVAPA